jgi:predicted RNase H-like nuclease
MACRAGWIAWIRIAGPVRSGFADLGAGSLRSCRCELGANAVIAVDMPIGLPDRIRGAGRGPEQAIRPLLGPRQSSVFSIPARAAVEAETYGEACARALETSDPPKKGFQTGLQPVSPDPGNRQRFCAPIRLCDRG